MRLSIAPVKDKPLHWGAMLSNLANGDKNPWAFGLNVEIPIETGNKRQIKIEEAQRFARPAH